MEEKKTARCEHFLTCGGCSWQDSTYEDQLIRKHEALSASLSALGFEAESIVKQMIPSPKQHGYRNRMDFVSFQSKEGTNGLGLREAGSWKRCIDIRGCLLMAPWQDDARRIIKEWQARNRIPSWDPRAHKGVLRYAVCRDSSDGKSKMVSIVSAQDKTSLPEIAWLTNALRGIEVTSSFVLKNEGWSDVSYGEPQLADGEGHISETIAGTEYLYGPTCFFQPNPFVAARMIDTVDAALKACESKEVLDMYCGVGLFSLAAAKKVERVTGVELAGESVTFAKRNAERNKIENVEFIESGAEKTPSRNLISSFDTVIADPPRTGLHPEVTATIAASQNVKTLIYSSCNPAKFVHDAAALSPSFILESAQPLDMFPQTPHFEVIGVFRRRMQQKR